MVRRCDQALNKKNNNNADADNQSHPDNNPEERGDRDYQSEIRKLL